MQKKINEMKFSKNESPGFRFKPQFIKKGWGESSLVVQWLIHHVSSGESPGSIPGQGTRPLHAATKSV